MIFPGLRGFYMYRDNVLGDTPGMVPLMHYGQGKEPSPLPSLPINGSTGRGPFVRASVQLFTCFE